MVLALLALLLPVAVLAQIPGDENGTDQVAGPSGKADSPVNESRDLFDYIQIIGIILGSLVSLILIYKFIRKKDGANQSLGNSYNVENTKDSAISAGDHSPAVKADRIEGGVHIEYHSSIESPKAGKPPGKISNFPQPHNRNFTGRESLLNDLHEALASGKYAAFTQTQAITGLGGVGKTQLALEYAYRHKGDYNILWWVRSEEPATLGDDYRELAAELNLPPIEDPREVVKAVRTWLEQNGDWLLVFDNAQRFVDLKDYLPKASGGHVIITSRNQSWGNVAEMLSVDVFTPKESVEFLRKRTGQKDDEAAKALAEALGNLPLALEQAGAYIKETGITTAAYLTLFQKRHEELLDRCKPSEYPDTVATTWDLSFKKAREEVPVSSDLLNLSSFLAPDEIPKSLLVEGSEHLPEPLASAVSDEILLNDAIAALKRYSLLSVTDDALSIHRLVQAVTRDRLKEEGEEKTWAGAAVRLVNGAFPAESYDIRNWPTCSLQLPHALASAKYAEELNVAPETASGLLNNVGPYLIQRAEFYEAKSIWERALKIKEKSYGPDHPDVAATVGNLGLVLRHLGDLEGARKCQRRALKIEEKSYGPDHPDVAATVMNLGNVLYLQGDLEGARNCQERALKIEENAYGPDHPDVARTVESLGLVLRALGDLEGARNCQERALKIKEKSYGPDHPDVAATVGNLGLVLQDLGDLEGARNCQERALKIKENVYGPDHPDVARTVGNLGLVLQDLGDLEGARENLERALRIFRERLGEDHPDTIKTRNNLESLRR